MGISEKMNNLADGMKAGVKTGSARTTLVVLRLLTAFFLALTISLASQEASHYGTLSLVFVTLVVMAVFMRVSQAWTIGHILIFDLILVLAAQLLRMYILLAP